MAEVTGDQGMDREEEGRDALPSDASPPGGVEDRCCTGRGGLNGAASTASRSSCGLVPVLVSARVISFGFARARVLVSQRVDR